MYGISPVCRPLFVDAFKLYWYSTNLLTHHEICSGQDLGDAVWSFLSAIAPRATCITVLDRVIIARSSLYQKELIKLELRVPLGPSGALSLGKALADSAMSSLLTALEIRSIARYDALSQLENCFYIWPSMNDPIAVSICRDSWIEDEGAVVIAQSICHLTSLNSIDLRSGRK